jgi:hypothetical protein
MSTIELNELYHLSEVQYSIDKLKLASGFSENYILMDLEDDKDKSQKFDHTNEHTYLLKSKPVYSQNVHDDRFIQVSCLCLIISSLYYLFVCLFIYLFM